MSLHETIKVKSQNLNTSESRKNPQKHERIEFKNPPLVEAAFNRKLDLCRKTMAGLEINDFLKSASSEVFNNAGKMVSYEGGWRQYKASKEKSPRYADGETEMKYWDIQYVHSTKAIVFFTKIEKKYKPDEYIGLFRSFDGYNGSRAALVVSAFSVDDKLDKLPKEIENIGMFWGLVSLNIVQGVGPGERTRDEMQFYKDNEQIYYPIKSWNLTYRQLAPRSQTGDDYPDFVEPNALVSPETESFQIISRGNKLGAMQFGLKELKSIITDDLSSQLIGSFGPNLKRLKLHKWGIKIPENKV